MRLLQARTAAVVMAALVSVPALGAPGAWAAAIAVPWNTVAADLGGSALPGSQVSALFANAQTGAAMYAQTPTRTIQPASTLKLLVSATALADLGPGYRFTTRVVGRVGPGGTVTGNLYLIGSGDPTLTTASLDALARSVAQRVRAVAGSVIVDAAAFAGPFGAGWPVADMWNGWSAGPSALTLDQNQVVLKVFPAASPGSAPRVVTTPAVGVTLDNLAATSAIGTRETVWPAWPPGSAVGASLTGNMPIGMAPARFTVSVRNPDAWAAQEFALALEAAGVRVRGSTGVTTVPAPAALPLLASHRSASLAAIIVHQNKWSINLYAEDLLRVVGARVYGGPGTAVKGNRAEMAWLKAQGIPWRGTVVDGCGLSLTDQVSAQDLVALLVRVRRQPWAKDFVASLPVAGSASPQVSGTLGEIGLFPAFHGMVLAKTGDVSDVENLAGYLRTASGQWVAFALLVKGLPTWQAGWHAEERAVTVVAGA